MLGIKLQFLWKGSAAKKLLSTVPCGAWCTDGPNQHAHTKMLSESCVLSVAALSHLNPSSTSFFSYLNSVCPLIASLAHFTTLALVPFFPWHSFFSLLLPASISFLPLSWTLTLQYIRSLTHSKERCSTGTLCLLSISQSNGKHANALAFHHSIGKGETLGPHIASVRESFHQLPPVSGLWALQVFFSFMGYCSAGLLYTVCSRIQWKQIIHTAIKSNLLWIPSWFSSFLPQSTDILVRWIGGSKLPRSVNVNVTSNTQAYICLLLFIIELFGLTWAKCYMFKGSLSSL